jgi:hypothetical protein
MKHLQHNIQFPPPETSNSIVETLRAKKLTLEKMIRDKFAQARLSHTKADVAQLSAALRQVKNSIEAAKKIRR